MRVATSVAACLSLFTVSGGMYSISFSLVFSFQSRLISLDLVVFLLLGCLASVLIICTEA